MPLTEQEEFELLSLKRKRSQPKSDLISQMETERAVELEKPFSKERFGAEPITTQEAFFPRTEAYEKELKETGKKASPFRAATNFPLDVASLVGRTIASSPALIPGGETFKEAMVRKAGKPREGLGKIAEFGDSMVRDAATPLTLPFGGGLVKEGVKPLIRTGIKEGIKRAGKTLARGAIESAPGAVIHQLENVAAGKDASIGEFAGEVGLGAGMMAGGKLTKAIWNKAKNAPKEVSEKIMANYVKATDDLVRNGYDHANFAKHDLFGSTAEIVAAGNQKVKQKTNELNSILAKLGKEGAIVDPADAVVKAVKEVEDNILSQPANLLKGGDEKAYQKAAIDIIDLIDQYVGEDPIKSIDITKAQEIKKRIGELADGVFGTPDADNQALETMAKRVYFNLKEQIDSQMPDAGKKLNKEMSEIIPLVRAARRAIPIENRKAIFSLTDVNIISKAIAAEQPAKGIQEAIFAGLNKASKSPITAEALQLGSDITGGATRPIRKPLGKTGAKLVLPSRQAARTGIFGAKDEEDKKQRNLSALGGKRF